MSTKRIYLDYAATTPLDTRVERAMHPFVSKAFGNPSSIHAEGVAARKALDAARTSVARSLEAHADEVVFTSGGTEANNLAISGVLSATNYLLLTTNFSRPHIVTTNIEHASILEPLRELERTGRAEVTYVPVESNGIVAPEKIIAAIKPNTILVSVMYANNEIGTVQPIRKIGQMIQDSRFKIHESPYGKAYPLFHTDACQAPLYLRCLVNALGVDLLSLDAHKIYGPKGVGALYVRRNTLLAPMLLGGGQERGLRSTTENIPGIIGFSEALRIATAEREKESVRIQKIRDILHSNILENVGMTKVVVNGDMKERLPNNLNISFPGIDTEFLTLKLDAEGIAVSTKSSCLKDEKESYVIAALGGAKPSHSDGTVARSASSGFKGKERARSSLRFTLGRATTKKEVDLAAKALVKLL